MTKIVTIVGARPQFIKAAVVSRALRAHRHEVREMLIHTGQHFDANMSDVFFDELEIPRPDHHLGIGGGTHGQNTGRMLEAIEAILVDERPDWVLVYGDTDSTLAGALAAAQLLLPVAHVESGLRSFNRRMPEELNRVLTDHAADLLFTPTETAVVNLRNEGITPTRIRRVGDVMYDAALFYAAKAKETSDIVARLSLRHGEYVLATVHRAENTDDDARLTGIMRGLMAVGRTHPVVMPLHPRTRLALCRIDLLDQAAATLILTAPLGYLDMVVLERHAAVVATDSGGVQKEAFFYGIPCVVLRHETEWVELVDSGAAELAGTSAVSIEAALTRSLQASVPAVRERGFFGDGHAGRRIAAELSMRKP
jgi:UDP-GlcNAc3NAcA epimerase